MADEITFRTTSGQVRRWILAHWLLVALWAFAAFEVGFSFTLILVGASNHPDSSIGVSFVLALVVIPVALAIARRFALDSLRYRKRSVTIKSDSRELIVRDPVWLDGEHVIPLAEIEDVSIAERTILKGNALQHGILDLTSRTGPRHAVYVQFRRPVEFERLGGPILFDLIFTFMDPGFAPEAVGIILEFSRPKEFLRACDQIGVKVAGGYTRGEETDLEPAGEPQLS